MDLSKFKIKKSASDIETHHVFLDTLAHSREAELGISEKKFEVPLSKTIIYLMFGIFFFLAIGLFSKTFYLQIINGEKLYTLSENNKGNIDLISPERGIVYDKNLKRLVLNSPAYDLVCNKKNFYDAKAQSVQ